jgi:hypothetical protein
MTIDTTAEKITLLRALVEQIGNAVACGLADPEDDDAVLAQLVHDLDQAGCLVDPGD